MSVYVLETKDKDQKCLDDRDYRMLGSWKYLSALAGNIKVNQNNFGARQKG